MKNTFRLSMEWLHTWSGLVAGWLLFAIFLTGSAAVFRNETSVWMTPEHGRPGDAARGLDVAESRLKRLAPAAASWTIVLPDGREPSVQVEWRARDVPANVNGPATPRTASATVRSGRELVNLASAEPVRLRSTQGGDFFYNFHHRLDQPSNVGWWPTGAAAILMLVGLVSGVVIHRRIFRDFFTFRPWASFRLSWLDAHTVMGVLALPFHLMITYTGLAPMLIVLMAPPIVANYAGDRTLQQSVDDYSDVRRTFMNERGLKSLNRSASGVAAPLIPLAAIVDRASQHWDGGRVGRLTVFNPGDQQAVVEVERHSSGQLAYQPERLFFDGPSGRLLGSTAPRGAAWTTFSVMWGLHEARFADTALRWVYFLLGLVSTAMIATGLVFWTVRRRAKHGAAAQMSTGHNFVERMNVGFITGLPVAMAAFFCANRLLPLDLTGRPLVETRVFYATWLVMLIFAAIRSPRRAWSEGMGIAALTFGAVPILNALTTDRSLLVSLTEGDHIMAGFDLTMLAIALMFGAASRKLAYREASAPLGQPVVRTLSSADSRV